MEIVNVFYGKGVAKMDMGSSEYRDPRDSFDKGHKTRTVHRMALLVHHRDLDISPRQQANHLCNNKMCINLKHLVFEDNQTNNRRKACFECGQCSGHIDYMGNQKPDCLVHLTT